MLIYNVPKSPDISEEEESDHGKKKRNVRLSIIAILIKSDTVRGGFITNDIHTDPHTHYSTMYYLTALVKD